MRRGFVFACSFIMLFIACQILPGFFQTLNYTPDMSAAGTGFVSGSEQVVFGEVSLIPTIFSVFISAIIVGIIAKLKNGKPVFLMKNK